MGVSKRWNSTSAEAEKEAKSDEARQNQEAETDSSKKELEAKDKEIIDLKVCLGLSGTCILRFTSNSIPRDLIVRVNANIWGSRRTSTYAP